MTDKTKYIPTGRPVGRPSRYKPEYCQMLIDHMEQGFSFETFAADIDSCRSEMYVWEEKHPEFSEAKKKGLEKSQKWWENLGRGGAAGKLKNFNAAVWIFNMKNRFHWRDVNHIKVDEKNAEKHITINFKKK